MLWGAMALTLHGKTVSYDEAAALIMAGIRGEEFASQHSNGRPAHLPINQIVPRLPRILKLQWFDDAGELVLEERQKVAEALRAWDQEDASLELMLKQRERAARPGGSRL